ncbi:MAG: CYTH domain-containing protein, partial [Acetobacteraceae bacterium]
MAAPTELEIKLLIPAAAAEAVAAHPLLQGGATPKVQQQVTTYFDTPGWDLAHMGASLRIRRRGKARVQTLKLRDAAGQAFERGEWEWPVQADAPDRALLAETPLAALLGSMPEFAPVFTTRIERRLRLL